jgi:hypothetical protein
MPVGRALPLLRAAVPADGAMRLMGSPSVVGGSPPPSLEKEVGGGAPLMSPPPRRRRCRQSGRGEETLLAEGRRTSRVGEKGSHRL